MIKTSTLRGTTLDTFRTEPCHASGAKPAAIGIFGWESAPMGYAFDSYCKKEDISGKTDVNKIKALTKALVVDTDKMKTESYHWQDPVNHSA